MQMGTIPEKHVKEGWGGQSSQGQQVAGGLVVCPGKGV